MERLYEYLRGEHATLRGVAKRCKTLSHAAWPTFVECRADRTWPYELKQDKDLPAAIAPAAFSASTHAMILFSLGTALGLVRESVLAKSLAGAIEQVLPGKRTPYEAAYKE